jgi:predicted PurR-regulated permease PerM
VAEQRPSYRNSQYLLTAASLVIVIGGLKLAAPIILPVLMAMLVALVAMHPIRGLQRRGLPTWLALTLIMIGASLALLFVIGVVGASITKFTAQLPEYRVRLDSLIADGFRVLRDMGADVAPVTLSKSLDSGRIMNLVGDTATGVLALLSSVLLVLLIVIFILLEANGFSAKLRKAMGDRDADLGEWTRAADRVYQYLFIKSVISAGTGVLVSLLTWLGGVDFPLLWGMVAFMFNFVPNIGSIIAAVPAVLLALLLNGVVNAAIIGAGYFVINMVIGNAIEPKIMGEKLGLSTLVVFLSLVFWGWLWGPAGMLLSVPLTVIVKIVLEHSEQFRFVAILLGPSPTDDST